MSLAMMLSWLVRCRMSVANGLRISLVPGISKLPVQVTKPDVPEADVIEHVRLPVADHAGGDDPVHELAIPRLHQVVRGELREFSPASRRERRQHVAVEVLI